MAAALSNLFADFPGMATRPLGFPVVAFVEAYIEQGPELDQQGAARKSAQLHAIPGIWPSRRGTRYGRRAGALGLR